MSSYINRYIYLSDCCWYIENKNTGTNRRYWSILGKLFCSKCIKFRKLWNSFNLTKRNDCLILMVISFYSLLEYPRHISIDWSMLLIIITKGCYPIILVKRCIENLIKAELRYYQRYIYIYTTKVISGLFAWYQCSIKLVKGNII